MKNPATPDRHSLTHGAPEVGEAQAIAEKAGKPLPTLSTGLLDEAELERQWQSFYRAVSPSRIHTRRAEAMHKRLTKRSGRREAA